MNRIKENILWIFLALYVVFATVIILVFNGTGDSGDSVLHFLYAKAAPGRPELYFHHWAKPVFTLLASPFAQFGFVGIKIFNSLVVLLTIYLTYRTAQGLNLKRPIIAALIIVCAPLMIRHTFSGLTEPLFGLFTIWGIYLIVRERLVFACIVISFLPFVRSEGLLIIGVVGCYLLISRNWKVIPWLLFGHAFYSLVGALVFGDLLWVFTKIPYASTESIYGSGSLFHFADQMPFVIGIPSSILLIVGMAVIIWSYLRGKFNAKLHVLILGGFLVYAISHSLFWYFGIFNSMGLNRVLLGVLPLIAIIGLIGANSLIDLGRSRKWASLSIATVLIGLILFFPVADNPSAVHWRRDMNLSGEQKVATEISQVVLSKYNLERRFIYTPAFLSVTLNRDHFDPKEHMDLHPDVFYYMEPGDIIIWDNWFSVVDSHIERSILDNDERFEHIHTSKGMNEDREVIYSAYIVREN